ncbi:hypothetical protein CEXT_643981 [Caerostris extrusa]|uniref:Uncharacterized protein n=1 Tax=Caerostris extrusa TaxID=172846 RepID=A0AAV4Y526_CAEEX|nr:hypothetical protein CEXT_643981 [Caerostris extrusa]
MTHKDCSSTCGSSGWQQLLWFKSSCRLHPLRASLREKWQIYTGDLAFSPCIAGYLNVIRYDTRSGPILFCSSAFVGGLAINGSIPLCEKTSKVVDQPPREERETTVSS